MTPAGINLIGDLQIHRGLGESARLTLDAIRAQGIASSYVELQYPGFPADQRDPEPPHPAMPRGSIYPINLIFYGLSDFGQISDAQLQVISAGKYTIACWVWEFPTIPGALHSQFARVDEIWTASQFCKQSMVGLTEKPITILPYPAQIALSGAPDRTRFGIPAGRYVFLFIFDAAGSIARKNPTGLVAAFERAFGVPDPNGPILVIKARHLDFEPQIRANLVAQMAHVGGILLTEEHTRAQTNDLLACADCYISLHRAEGFGLTMVEAMALGKPVIATNYSGNVDYMNAANSYLVDYQLRPVLAADHADQPRFGAMYDGGVWAEPDLDGAANWMRHLYQNQAEGRARGAMAAADIRRSCGPETVGIIAKNRLEYINAQIEMH